MIKSVVFDLDGTLISSHKTIFNSTIKALEELNLSTEINEDIFNNLIGHHFEHIFDICNVKVPNVEHFIDVFKGYYFDFIDDSFLYNNVITTLKTLHNRNVKTAILTTKGQDQAELIAEHFGLAKYIDSVQGRKKEFAIKPSPDQLLYLCKKFNSKPEETFMVGDTELDIKCGKNANAKTCAVSYGYRNVEDLEVHSPNYIIDDLFEVIEVI